MFDAFLEAGGNFIDTANTYSNGASETYLGEFTRSARDRMVLASKYSNTISAGNPNAGGNCRKTMMESLHGTLKRLNTDYIDVYWLHIWDFMTPVEEVLRAFDDMIRAGKVLYIGISDTPAWVVARANAIAELRGWVQFVGLQVEYSLVARTPDRELLPMARELGLTVTAWSPLGGGLLTGKYSDTEAIPRQPQGPRRLDTPQWTSFWALSDRNLSIAQEVVQVARQIGCTPSQVAIAWLRLQGTVPIIGARSVGQLAENLRAGEVVLEQEQLERLEAISRISLGFPYDFYELDMIRSLVYGGTYDQIDVRRPS
jgi:aryl-alcohol dehydrogenase-like predicted oxidoreductase